MQTQHFRYRALPLGEALLTAAIWSSSFVGVKVALSYAGPFTVAGLRYFIAFLLLLPWLCLQRRKSESLKRPHYLRFGLMALSQYVIGNGCLFLALRKLSATTGSLALCLVPIPVLFIGMLHLGERLRGIQLLGVAVAIGSSILFLSGGLETGDALSLGLLGISILGFSAFPVLTRELARTRQLDNVTITAIPLGIGGGILLLIAALVEGIPEMPLLAWGVILGLALVNTLIAYMLYNHSLRHLTAVEANVLLNLAPLGTAVIAWAALGEKISPVQIAAILLVVLGASLSQSRGKRPKGAPS